MDITSTKNCPGAQWEHIDSFINNVTLAVAYPRWWARWGK